MADVRLAGLPRLVRVPEEVRWRGITAIAAGAAVAAYWLTAWLVGQPIRVSLTWLAAAIVAVPAAIAATLASVLRYRDAEQVTPPPPRRAVYETQADGRDRRTRLASVVFLAVLVLLIFDRVAHQHGVVAGALVGALLPAGLVDVVEGRRWRGAERGRDARLYVLVRPRALVAPLGRVEVYEEPREDGDRRLDLAEAGLRF